MIFRGLRFCLNYCLALVGTFLIVIGIEWFPGLDAGYYSLVVMPLVVVSVIEGKSFARIRGSRPRNCQACLAALQMSVIAILIAKLAFLGGTKLAPLSLSALGLPSFENAWLTVAVFAAVSMVVLRLGFAFGIAVELNGQRASARAEQEFL